MRVVLQRVKRASVTVKTDMVGDINSGVLILLGIETADTQEDINWLCGKICRLRIFDDSDGVVLSFEFSRSKPEISNI